MPEYVRPRRAIIETDDGWLLAVGVVGVVVLVILLAVMVLVWLQAHLVLLAATAGGFLAVMGGILAVMRWVASPARLRRQLHPLYTAPISGRTAQAIPAAQPRAIGAPRTSPGTPTISGAPIAAGERAPLG